MNIHRLIVFCFLALPGTWAAAPFVHTVTPDNLDGHSTVLDHPSVNGLPDRLLFVSQRTENIYNPHEIGVWYDKERFRWTIYNEDREPLQEGLKFNVVALDANPYVLTHTTTAKNTIEYYTMINHPATDNNPDAILLIVPNHDGEYVPSPLGVWYTGTQWSIYRQDKAPLLPGVRFNVMVVEAGNKKLSAQLYPNLNRAFIHKAGEANTRGHITSTEITEAREILFITHNWATKGPYNFHVSSLWHNAQEWTILNQDRGLIEPNCLFNVFIFQPSAEELAAAKPAAPVLDQTMGFVIVKNDATYISKFTITYALDGKRQFVSSGNLNPGQSRKFDIFTRAQDLRIKVEAIQDARKVIGEKAYSKIPNGTLKTTGNYDNADLLEE